MVNDSRHRPCAGILNFGARDSPCHWILRRGLNPTTACVEEACQENVIDGMFEVCVHAGHQVLEEGFVGDG